MENALEIRKEIETKRYAYRILHDNPIKARARWQS